MDYSKLGWHTFPCNGKFPATPKGFYDADVSGDVFNKYKGANVAIRTGKESGVFVLDVDTKPKKDGRPSVGADTLDGLIAKHGPLPTTVQAKTWSGGSHYFFKMPNHDLPCRIGFLPDLDIRADGGYALLPPSTIDGKPYAWVVEPGNGVPIADAPGWLLSIIDKPKPTLAADTDNPAIIIEGNRNAELTSRGGKMRAVGMTSEQIYNALCTINTSLCKPTLSNKEVRIISESVGRYVPNNINAPLTDLWNSERFVEVHGENIRWCPTLGWMMWNGTVWSRKGPDDPELTMLAKEFVKSLTRQAESTDNKRLKTHACKSESAGKLSAIVELAKSEKGMAVPATQFDKDIHLLNCANGTLDLNTEVLSPHKREDFITKSINVNYEPAAKCPTWLKFLDDIFQHDKDLIDYVQRAIGYCLSGDTREQKFFICYGNGRNGKSTLLKHIMHVLGSSYSTGTPAETMLESNGNTLHAIASLKAMRLVVLNEFDEGKTLSSAQVKTLTGGESVVARHLYHEQFVYTPTYKFFMTTNHKPRIKDTSLGIWRRLVLLPFDYTVPSDKINPFLDQLLAQEYPGILAWAVAGYKAWAAGGLPILERLTREAMTYQGQSDLIGQFLEECRDTTRPIELAETGVVDFIRALDAWCRENGVKHSPGRSAVIDYMARQGFGMPVRDNNMFMRGKMAWRGFAIKPEIGHTGLKEKSWD